MYCTCTYPTVRPYTRTHHLIIACCIHTIPSLHAVDCALIVIVTTKVSCQQVVRKSSFSIMEKSAVMKTASEAVRNKTSVTATASVNSSGERRHTSSPLVKRVYQARMLCMKKCIEAALSSFDQDVEMQGDTRQLLVLGCGLDTSYNNYSSTSVFLVDFEEIIQKRRAANENTHGVASEHCIAGDLRDADDVLHRLCLETPFDPQLPTVSVTN